MMTVDVNVFLIDLPPGTNEAVTENADGSYTILISTQLSPMGQQEAYEHAMKHIEDCDFEKESVQEIEMQTHRLTPPPVLSVENVAKPETPKRKRRHKSSARQWREVNERIAFMSKYDPDYAFKEGEYNKLYGGL